MTDSEATQSLILALAGAQENLIGRVEILAMRLNELVCEVEDMRERMFQTPEVTKAKSELGGSLTW